MLTGSVSTTSSAQLPASRIDVDEPRDIIVTAQRRSERQIDVPAAITSLSGKGFDAADLGDTKAVIRFTPGFSGFAENNFVDGIAIRGIVSNDYGLGGDPSIGIFRDGVHQGRTGSVITTAYDLERVEALRGPQVFLFGRNAISGALAIVTKAPEPDAAEGYVTIRAGTRHRFEVQGAYNAALGDGWALRAAVDRETERGSSQNASFPNAKELGSRDVAATRVSLLHRGNDTTVRLTGEYDDRELGGTPHRARINDAAVIDLLRELNPQLEIRGGRRDVDSDLSKLRDHSRVGSLTLRIDHDAGSVTLASLTGLRAHRYRYLEDYDGTPLVIDSFGVRQHGDYASQEFTAVSTGKGPLQWAAGISAYHERVKGSYTNGISERIVCGPGYGYADCNQLVADIYGRDRVFVPAADGILTDVNRAKAANWGISAYGALDWKASPDFTIGAGARYTWDHKRFDLDVPQVASTLGNVWLSTYYTSGYVRAAQAWDGVSPRVYARWAPNHDWTIYLSATKAMKAGGFGTFSLVASEPLDDYDLVPAGTKPDDYGKETVRSVELGVKGRLPDGRGTAAITAFHYIYNDLQANVFDPVLRSTQVINIGRVRGTGIEAEAALRFGRHVSLALTGAWTRTVKTGDRGCTLSDCGGLGNPTLTTSAILRLQTPLRNGELYVQSEAFYASRARGSFDDRGFGRVPVCARGDVRLGYAGNAEWSLESYVRNVTDSLCYAGADNGGGISPATLWGPILARTAGLALTRRF